MELDYKEIGKRIARRRKQLGLKQFQVEERADIGYKYLSSIERAISIPSTEVIMKLALALETTPDEFLVGASLWPEEDWRSVAEKLRTLNAGQLELVRRMHQLGLVYACLEVEELGEALRWVRSHPPKPFRSNTEAFLASLDQFLGAL